MGNTNVVDMNIRVPKDLHENLVLISAVANSDLNADLLHLLECYVDTGKRLLAFPAAVDFLED